MDAKARVLLVGAGGVGAIAALNLEEGGRATVTAVLRSSFRIVSEEGYQIDSVDHGILSGWRPSEGIVNLVCPIPSFVSFLGLNLLHPS